ncbi:MAG: DHHA1 domain-containing protein [Candidatus Thorarchaeota archaeon]
MSEIPPYWNNQQLNQFEVTVKLVKKVDELFHILIKENVIRPAGGGQAGEKGRLSIGNSSTDIIDTIEDSEGVILVSNEPIRGEGIGFLEIDMNWRLNLMRNHTAEHLLVSSIKKKFEEITVGNLWIDGRHGSVEIIGVELDIETVFDAELELMRIIEEDLPVRSHFVDSDQIDSSIRKREGLEDKYDQLRVVSVGEVDSSACSGIHVAKTGDIGFFKVIDVKTNDIATQIEFITGMAARIHVINSYNMAFQRKNSYPFEMEQLGTVLDKAKLAIDEKHMLIEKVTQILTSGSTVEHIGTINYQYEYLPGYEPSSLKILTNRMLLKEPTIILLFSPGRKSQVLLKVNKTPLEASEYILKPLLQLGGKGGGKGEIFTGGFVDVENPEELYNKLVNEVRMMIG